MNNNQMSLMSQGSWNLIKCLGSGAFGEVHHWRHKFSGQEIATKRLKPNPKLRPDEVSILHKRWSQEYEWMKLLTTKYIVAAAKVNDDEFLQYLIRQSHVEHTLPVILMEYCNGGDLRCHLNKIENINGLVEYEVRSVLYTLRESINYLHLKCNIEHRDIKPENIVLHVEGSTKIYKLTDFGYAREIPESTVAQSIVGTRNYVAPEVIDPGCYTQTVDYWSAGHVAYEILCGTLPFVPHQNFVKRLQAIKAKPPNCIRIVQNVDDPYDDKFDFEYDLPYNHSSSIFNHHLQKWLYLSLDKNYKTRGVNEFKQLQFYSLLDEMLKLKILTVFSLKKCKKYYYDIESFPNMQAFAEKLAYDNEIEVKNLFLITPPGHPKTNFKQPSDYFVREWCDTSHLDNPPVMLFVNEFITKSAFNIDVHMHFKPSATVVKCMNINPQDSNIPQWLLQQFEREVHFTLAEKQNIITCYMLGLQQFVMQIQHAVFFYETAISQVNDQLLMLAGSIQLFSTVIDEIKQFRNGSFKESVIESEVKDFLAKALNYNDIIKKTYKIILQKCKELGEDKFYKQIIEEDIFLLKEYRTFLAHVNSSAERLSKGQHYFENCLQKFGNFFNDSQRKYITDSINNEITHYNSLQYAVFKIKNDINNETKKVENATRSLLKDYHTNNELSSQMDTLNIDGAKTNVSLSGSTNNTLTLSCDSMALINDSMELMDAINNQCNFLNNLPTN